MTQDEKIAGILDNQLESMKQMLLVIINLKERVAKLEDKVEKND